MSDQILAGWIWGLTILTVFVVLAVLPTVIAIIRGADEILLIMLVNALCCATVIGWPIALIMAIKWPRKHPRPNRAPHARRPSPPYERHHTRRAMRGPYG
ncbi:superinfection immunity protein [Actinomadura opuntiae]|uniref:superinfection immunity protein n=1 Tax=Actinomadura sp. OS1-43 TaxID=604315 RepID=UPI00255AE6F0|nr:superinfection immunity protein [Actinomadura sp. OS1-43]MDL4813191.1 superinfection immunity protein [Actinomadura sp. OS1-43]